MAADLIKEFADAGTYQILENDKFDPTTLFVLLGKDNGTAETDMRTFPFKELQKQVKKGCINEIDKTITFSVDMSPIEFLLAILFWASTKSNKRSRDGAGPARYEVNYAELVANLVWVKNKIGTIHTLNAGR